MIKIKTHKIIEIPFYLFDYEKQEINKEELLTRYEILSSFVHTLTNNDKKKLQHLIPKNKINIVVKDFVFENKKANITINQCCETLLNKIATNNYRYNTDGIIFTSKYLGVTQEKEGDIIKNKKIHGDIVSNGSRLNIIQLISLLKCKKIMLVILLKKVN